MPLKGNVRKWAKGKTISKVSKRKQTDDGTPLKFRQIFPVFEVPTEKKVVL